MTIPPRPWNHNGYPGATKVHLFCGEPTDEEATFWGEHADALARKVAQLLNAEPEIVAALEAAERVCDHANGYYLDCNKELATIRAALARLRP